MPERAPAADTRLRAPRWLPAAFVIVIGAAVLGGYGATLDHGFTNWDDNWLITENRHIRGLGWENIQMMFNPLSPREELGNEYLPLRDLSYAVNYALDGYNARGYHATNLLLHFFNALLVMLLAWRLTARRWIGCVAGLLFAVMPVQVEAVAWLSSRKDLLATFFMLGSANFYLAARRPRTHVMPSESFVRRVRENSRLLYTLALLLFVFALLSKMTSVVLPALLLLIELFRGHSLHAASWRRRALITAPFWAVALLFTALASHIGSGLMREPYGDGRWQSLLTAVSAITRDFQAVFVAWPLHAAVDLPVQTGPSLAVVAGALLFAGLLALGAQGWRVSRRGEWGREACMAWGATGLGALWFLVALSPVSNLVVQIGTVFAERYLYIPSIGIALALATLGVMAVDKLRTRRELRPLVHLAAAGALSCVVGAAVWRTSEAAKPWANSERLWTHALSHDPGNHVAHFNLGRDLEDRAMSEPEEARRQQLLESAFDSYRRALEHPARTYRNDPARVLGAMALNQVHRGDAAQALELLDRAAQHIDQPWRDDNARNDILALLANPRGLALSELGRHEEALAAFEQALSHSSRYQGARINLAAELGRAALAGAIIDQATLDRAYAQLAEYERARRRDELSVEARARLRMAEFDKRLALSGKGGQQEVPPELAPLLEEARRLYAELVDLRTQGAATPAQLAATLLEAADAHARGSPGNRTAERYLRQAMDEKPGFMGLRTLLAQLLFERDSAAERREATKLLTDELERYPDYAPAKALKAAGLRQNFVNQIARLQQDWTAEYAAITNDDKPTLEGLVTRFHPRETFRNALLTCVALLRTAVEIDPDNTEGHALMDDLGVRLALAMWFTRAPELRITTEQLLRAGFNANPVEGQVSELLTEFYTQLAEQVLARPERTDEDAVSKRADLNTLLENMLKLSETARRILSRRLLRIGQDVERGDTRLKGERGEELGLSEGARRDAAHEFIKAATLLNPENIVALDWLKAYYEDSGDLEEALSVFDRLMNALGDRPDLKQNLHISLAQLQHRLGEQIHRSFQHAIRLGNDSEARELRNRTVNAFLKVLETTGWMLDNPSDPDKISQPVRLRGAACQRLAYLLTADAEKYYTLALEAYGRAPLDFAEEITDVRRKRAWFVRDPYRRLDELKQIRADAPPGKDISDVIEDIVHLQRRIARLEAEDLLARGKPTDALEALSEAMRTPTPELYAIRGQVRLALAADSQGTEADRLTVQAARDLALAVNDADALLQAGELFWTNPAMSSQADWVSQARRAYAAAELQFSQGLATMEASSPARPGFEAGRDKARERLRAMEKVGANYLGYSQQAQDDGELEQALRHARNAIDFVGDSPVAWQRLGRVQHALADAGGAEAGQHARDARGSYQAALRIDHLLTSQRIELQLDLARLLLERLDDVAGARNWLEIAQRTLEATEGESAAAWQKLYQPRIDELKQRATR